MVQIKAGDRLKSPKEEVNFVIHHAIYVGIQNGLHYVIENQIGIGVRLIPLDLFLKNHPTCQVEPFRGCERDRHSVIQKALGSLGKKYNLFQYNCETFANEVQYGVRMSHQVTSGLQIAGVLALVTFSAIIIDKLSPKQ